MNHKNFLLKSALIKGQMYLTLKSRKKYTDNNISNSLAHFDIWKYMLLKTYINRKKELNIKRVLKNTSFLV